MSDQNAKKTVCRISDQRLSFLLVIKKFVMNKYKFLLFHKFILIKFAFERFFVLEIVPARSQKLLYQLLHFLVQQLYHIGMIYTFTTTQHKAYIIKVKAMFQIEHLPLNITVVTIENLVNIIIFKLYSLKICLALFDISITI